MIIIYSKLLLRWDNVALALKIALAKQMSFLSYIMRPTNTVKTFLVYTN